LNRYIFENFTYCTDSTHVHTCAGEVMQAKRGVCQDFAHVFLAACRACGVPSRYVSGYLVTRRARSSEGSSASHAWVEALVPNHGWCAFDPTNNLLANDSYIKIAHGRNYSDVTPTRGLFKGAGVDCRMSVRVHTMTEEALSSPYKEDLVG
jgi:transglutaminase-like putative cysteine protease